MYLNFENDQKIFQFDFHYIINLVYTNKHF